MPESSTINSKRIAKNTMMLYIRMLITMAISIYTSRVVLRELGVSDYGVYNVVAGMVSLITFLNSSMSGATSRYLTYAQGKKDFDRLKKTFGSSLLIHVGIGLVILLLLETVGLWFLRNYISIPDSVRSQAFWVFQCASCVTFLSIIRVPFVATIISHEKMNAYAYVEILNSCFNLAIALSLSLFIDFRLVIYAGMVLISSLIISIIYIVYSTIHFPESDFRIRIDKGLIRPMFAFFGWDLYGNMSVMARGQGVNMLINIFFGVIGNAAYGIATQVQSAVSAFSNNVVMAVKPQIIKAYASQEYEGMINLIFSSSKFIFTLLLIVGLPIIVEMKFILQLWLGEVPKYSVIFAQLNVLFLFFSSLSFVSVTGVHATGNIKRPSFINGTIYLSVIPLTYIFYKLNFPIYVPFILNVVFVICGCIVNLSTLHKNINQFRVSQYLKAVLLPCSCVLIISYVCGVCFHSIILNDWLNLIAVAVSTAFITLLLSYYFVASKIEQVAIQNIIKKYVSKHETRP